MWWGGGYSVAFTFQISHITFNTFNTFAIFLNELSYFSKV